MRYQAATWRLLHVVGYVHTWCEVDHRALAWRAFPWQACRHGKPLAGSWCEHCRSMRRLHLQHPPWHSSAAAAAWQCSYSLAQLRRLLAVCHHNWTTSAVPTSLALVPGTQTELELVLMAFRRGTQPVSWQGMQEPWRLTVEQVVAWPLTVPMALKPTSCTGLGTDTVPDGPADCAAERVLGRKESSVWPAQCPAGFPQPSGEHMCMDHRRVASAASAAEVRTTPHPADNYQRRHWSLLHYRCLSVPSASAWCCRQREPEPLEELPCSCRDGRQEMQRKQQHWTMLVHSAQTDADGWTQYWTPSSPHTTRTTWIYNSTHKQNIWINMKQTAYSCHWLQPTSIEFISKSYKMWSRQSNSFMVTKSLSTAYGTTKTT